MVPLWLFVASPCPRATPLENLILWAGGFAAWSTWASANFNRDEVTGCTPFGMNFPPIGKRF